MTLVIFFIILSLLVLVHEFGHFITAKKSGIKVEEFGLGIPPRVYGKKFGETLYSLNLLPLGGFVKLFGEDTIDEDIENHPDSYASKPWYKRFIVITAGVFMNLVLAVFIYYIFFIFNNFQSFSLPIIYEHNFRFGEIVKNDSVIMGISDDSNLNDYDINLGDSIVNINGININSIEDVRDVLNSSENIDKGIATIIVKDTNNKYDKEYNIETITLEDGVVVLGVYLGSTLNINYSSNVQKALSGFMHTYNMFTYSVGSMYHLISTSIKNSDIQMVSQGVSGPVGIYNVVGSIVNHSDQDIFLSLLDFTALLSISLAFINMLPIPALDGGRLIFIIIEVLRGGKKLNRELEAKIHGVGMLLLLGLFVLITAKDLLQ